MFGKLVFKTLLAALSIATLSSQANAKPIYLDCTRANGAKDDPMRETFTLDESTDSGTRAIPATGLATGKLPADFGQQDVVLKDQSDDGIIQSTYIFSRLTLSYTLIRTIGNNVPRTFRGKCSVGRPPARKF